MPQIEQSLNIKVEIETVTFHNKENGWSVLKGRNCNTNASITVTGSIPSVHPGETYTFSGQWVAHPSFGKQFKFERAEAVLPTNSRAIEKYLASGAFAGVGDKIAKKIVARFGDNTLDILDNDPDRLYQIPLLGKKKVKTIIETWQAQRSQAEVSLFLTSHNITPRLAQKIIKVYGPNTVEIIKNDPYLLAIDIYGVGFLTADRIAQSVGIAPDSPQRIKAAILYELQSGEDAGHCFLSHDQLAEGLQGLLSLSFSELEQHLRPCLDQLIQLNYVASEAIDHDLGHNSHVYYRYELLLAEVNAASHLMKKLRSPFSPPQPDDPGFVARLESWLEKYSEKTSCSLSEDQLAAVKMAASEKVFILTGGPGVGKTTTANTIIQLFKAMGRSICLAAPTGRAAQRLSEVTGHQAKTIHRLLEWSPMEHSFLRNEENPLPYQVVVIDEASMLDVRLASQLFEAVAHSAQLIMIGDTDQLPSVGAGNVLRDLIESRCIPAFKLRQIFRQASSSQIVATAHTINSGELPEFSNDPHSDCRFIDCESWEEVKHKIKQLVTEVLPPLGWDPKQDVQILTPMNRGELGTQLLNEELQSLLNPPRPHKSEFKRRYFTLRQGDKVIQNSNDYDLSVFNGDIGFVTGAGVEKEKLIVQYNDRTVIYDEEKAAELKLAYAITIHKSQGSEFPVVIVPISMNHYVMLQRNLIYTGLTRAKKLAIFVGSKKALAYAARNQPSLKRQSMLVQRIQHMMQEYDTNR